MSWANHDANIPIRSDEIIKDKIYISDYYEERKNWQEKDFTNYRFTSH